MKKGKRIVSLIMSAAMLMSVCMEPLTLTAGAAQIMYRAQAEASGQEAASDTREMNGGGQSDIKL